jgi:hypothetical protein
MTSDSTSTAVTNTVTNTAVNGGVSDGVVFPHNLKPSLTPGAGVKLAAGEENTWHFEIPPGPQGKYRGAQLEDYDSLSRAQFAWGSSLTMSLQARVSAPDIPGTWGFGLWNDPFSFSLGFGGGDRQLPALPNAAWFFFASPQNYLSLRNDLPAHDFLAATFQALDWPPTLLGLAVPALPLFVWKPTSRLLRRWGRALIKQDAAQLNLDVTTWHDYQLTREKDKVTFVVDHQRVFETPVAPYGRLGLVLWIDNQYAALPPEGGLAYGTLQTNENTWMEIKGFEVSGQ